MTMKINQLRIEPHVVKPDLTEDYLTSIADGFVLWKVMIDDELITDSARPFQFADSIIELKTNCQIPVWFDGADYVSVRKISNYIIWFSNLEFDKVYYTRWDKGDIIFIFDIRQYETECKNGDLKSEKLNLKLPDFGGKSPQKTQTLHATELLYLLELNFPDTYTTIYREPNNPLDTTGTIILRRMQLAIQHMTDFKICEAPEKQIELRIGLDESEFTEAIWHIGKHNDKFAIYFEQRPYFPMWLQSDVFDKVLLQEPFSKDL